MGIFSVNCKIGAFESAFMVDTGATYTVAPGHVLRKNGILPLETRRVCFADGREAEMEVGSCLFEIVGNPMKWPVPVIFGDDNAPCLLGATTLEIFGLIPDPIGRQLITAKALLVSTRIKASD